VRQLELELGVSLLTRSTRKVELTESGEALLAYGRSALDSVEAAWKAVRHARGAPARLWIAYDPLLGHRFVSEAHAAFVARQTGIHVSWRPRYNADLASDVLAGRFDAAISIVPERLDGLEYETISHQPLMVIMGIGHPLAQRQEIALQDLRRQTILALPRDFAPRFVDELARLHQNPEIDAQPLETPEPEGSLTLHLYASGEAIALAPASIADEYVARYRDSVLCVPLDTSVPPLPVTIVHRLDSDDDDELQDFVAVCREVARGRPAV
jgi:LysR family cyn operon transcriptional activator